MNKFFTTISAICIALTSFGQGQTQVLTEDFNGSTIPTGWTQQTMATDGGWIAGSAASLSSSAFPIPSTGSNIVATNDDDCNCNKTADYLISTPVDLSSYTSVHVGFKMFYLHEAYQGAQENAAFLYSTDNGTTWTTVQNITTGSGDWQDMYFDVSGAAGTGNDSVLFAFRYGDGGGWNYGMAIDDFAVYIPYNYDFAATNLDLYEVQGLNNAPFTIEGEIQNLGGQTVNSLDINYQIDGSGTVHTTSLTNLNLAPFAVYQFSHPTTWNPSAAATYDVEIWASNLDGTTDQNASNDKLLKEIQVLPSLTTRYPLYETFTSSTCPPCVPANITMENIFGNNAGEHVSLKYQMSWPGTGDPYYTTEGGVRRQYYGINAVPYVQIDGGWNSNGNSLTQAVYDQYQSVPAFVELEANYSISGQTVNVDVEIDPIADVTSSNLRLFVAIKEKTTYDNIKTNGETEFFDVMKKMVPDAQGDAIAALQGGTTVNKSYSYTFNGSYVLPPNANSPVNHAIAHTVEEFSDLAVAVWIQDINTKEIFQAAEATLVIGVEEFDEVAQSLKVYPNPASALANVEFDLLKDGNVTCTLVNATGQTAWISESAMQAGKNKISMDVSDLAAGIYLMNIEIDGVSTTKRISITR